MSERLAHSPVFVGDAVALADYFALPVIKFLINKTVELFRINFKFHIFLDVYAAAEYVRDGERVALSVGLYRFVYVYLGELVLYFAEIHFYLVIYYTLTEMYCNAVYAESVRIIPARKPEYTLFCTENTDDLTAGERLRVMRLRAGYTIEQAAQAVGVERRCVMNYELGKKGYGCEIV